MPLCAVLLRLPAHPKRRAGQGLLTEAEYSSHRLSLLSVGFPVSDLPTNRQNPNPKPTKPFCTASCEIRDCPCPSTEHRTPISPAAKQASKAQQQQLIHPQRVCGRMMMHLPAGPLGRATTRAPHCKPLPAPAVQGRQCLPCPRPSPRHVSCASSSASVEEKAQPDWTGGRARGGGGCMRVCEGGAVCVLSWAVTVSVTLWCPCGTLPQGCSSRLGYACGTGYAGAGGARTHPPTSCCRHLLYTAAMLPLHRPPPPHTPPHLPFTHSPPLHTHLHTLPSTPLPSPSPLYSCPGPALDLPQTCPRPALDLP